MNLFRNLFSFDLVQMLYFIPVVLITITIHECAHGYVAYKMGDPTAKMMGRLSLNPLKHIDPIGFVMMVLLRFGWAKPVMINARNFKNPKKGMALSALAGPVSNILMMAAGIIICGVIENIYFAAATSQSSVVEAALFFFTYFAQLNVYFAIFNLLPVPPLDGSRIVSYFLPYKLNRYYNYIERYGFLVLIILMWTGILGIPLSFLSKLIVRGTLYILNFVPFLSFTFIKMALGIY